MSMANSADNLIEARITQLRGSYSVHLELARKLAVADGGNIFGVDLVAWAVLNRSLSLVDGFTMMVEAKNILCAGALLRLQLDSLMRLYACWLVDHPHKLVEPLLRGDPLKLTKSSTGKNLTDRYLAEELSKIYPWVESVYKATCGYVHLSKPHMISTVNHVDSSTGNLSLGLGKGARKAKAQELIEALDAFIETTQSLLHLAASWLATKENVRAKPA